MFNLHLIITLRLQVLHHLIRVTRLGHGVLAVSVVVHVLRLLIGRAVIIEVLVVRVTAQVLHDRLFQAQLADALALEQAVHRAEVRTRDDSLRPRLLFEVVEGDRGAVLTLQLQLDIEHLVARVGVGLVTVVGHARDVLMRSRGSAYVVGILQGGLVDEEQRAVHEVHQAALGLVHTAHVGEAAGGAEAVGVEHLDVADELQQAHDQQVARVVHGALQATVVALGQDGLVRRFQRGYFVKVEVDGVRVGRGVEDQEGVGLLALAEGLLQAEHEGLVRRIGLVEKINRGNCLISRDDRSDRNRQDFVCVVVSVHS